MNKLLFFAVLNCLLQGLQVYAALPAGTTAPLGFKRTLTMRKEPVLQEYQDFKLSNESIQDLPLEKFFTAQAEPNSKEPFDHLLLKQFIQNQAMIVAKKDFSLKMDPSLRNDPAVKERFNSSRQARILYDRAVQKFDVATKAAIDLVQSEIQKALNQQRMIEQQRQMASPENMMHSFKNDLEKEVQDFINLHSQDKVKQPITQLEAALIKELSLVKKLGNFDQGDVIRWISEKVVGARSQLVKIAAPTQQALEDTFKQNLILKIQNFIKAHEKDVIKQPLDRLQKTLQKELDILKKQTQLKGEIAAQIEQEQMQQAHQSLVKMAAPNQEAIDLGNRLKIEAVSFVTQNSSMINFNERLKAYLESAAVRSGIPLQNIDVQPLVVQAMNEVLSAVDVLNNLAANFSYQESLRNNPADIQRLRDYLKERAARVEIQLDEAELHRLIEDTIKEHKDFMLPGTPEDTEQEVSEDEDLNQE